MAVKAVTDFSQFEVGRPEGVPPFGDAMGFVDGKVGDAAFRDAVKHRFSRKDFGIGDDQACRRLSVRSLEPAEQGFPLFGALSAAEEYGLDAVFPEAPGLVAHQGKQWIYDEGGAVEEEGGNLETKRFARARREEHDLPSAERTVLVEEFVVVRFPAVRAPDRVDGIEYVRDDEPLPGKQVPYAEYS